MDLSRIKLVVTDMDGTLLNSKHQVSPLFFDLYKQLRKNNILFVAASGRQFGSIAEKLAPIRDEIIIIAENGGYAVQHGKELVSTALPGGKKNEVLKELSAVPDAHPILCCKDSAYISESSRNFQSKLQEYYTTYQVIPDLYEFDQDILKIAVYHDINSEQYIYPAVQSFESDLQVKVSGEHWVDLSHPDANKGYALKKIQDSYGISPEETLVFGDYNNDLEMLSLATFSVAMANAHPNVLSAANYKTLTNDEGGVEHILQKMLDNF
ncbi:MAG: HAD family phosphatase [Flavobacteriaceae bacterium]|nr:HAD family phosphatase [Flavobacteriaceae bacterium]